MELRDTISHTEHWEDAIQNGKYVTWMMYKELRGDSIQVRWRKILFTNYARPRVIFTLWMDLMRRLPTRDRLHMMGLNMEQQCCFYECEENINTCFFFAGELAPFGGEYSNGLAFADQASL